MSRLLFILLFFLCYDAFTRSNAQTPCEISKASSDNVNGTIEVTYELTEECRNETFGLQILCDQDFIEDSSSQGLGSGFGSGGVMIRHGPGSGTFGPGSGTFGPGSGTFRPGSGTGPVPGSGTKPPSVEVTVTEIDHIINATTEIIASVLIDSIDSFLPAGFEYYCRLNVMINESRLTKAIDPITIVSGIPSTPIILNGKGTTNDTNTVLEVTLRCEHTGVNNTENGGFAFQILVMNQSETVEKYIYNETHPMPEYMTNTTANVTITVTGGDNFTFFAAAKNKYGSSDIHNIIIEAITKPTTTTTTTTTTTATLPTTTSTTSMTSTTSTSMTSSTPIDVGPIVGGVVGGVLVAVLIAVIILSIVAVLMYIKKSKGPTKLKIKPLPVKEKENTTAL